jgi:hypothetical protein
MSCNSESRKVFESTFHPFCRTKKIFTFFETKKIFTLVKQNRFSPFLNFFFQLFEIVEKKFRFEKFVLKINDSFCNSQKTQR